MANKLKLEITVDDKGSAVVKGFGTTTEDSFKKAGTGSDKMKTKLVAATEKLGSMTSKAAETAAKVTALGVAFAGAAAAFVLKGATEKFAEFETALHDMGKVTDESFESIKQRIRSLDPELGTATDLVKGYYATISAGVTEPTEAMDLLTEASKMGKAAHMEQSETIEALTKFMAGYKGEVESASEAADWFFTVEKMGQTKVAELIPVVGSLAAMSKDLGISQDELGGALALVTQTAGSTAEAATQYQSILTGLMKPTKDMIEAQREMGYESGAAMIEQEGLAGALKKLTEHTGGSAEKMAGLFGRVEAIKGMSALAANDFATLTENVAAMGEKTGASADAWEDYKSTLSAIWDTFKNTVGNQLIMIGEKLAPAIKDVVDAVGGWLEKNQELITQKIGDVIEKIVPIVTFLADNFGILEAAVYAAKQTFFIIGDTIAKVASELVDAYNAVEKFIKGIGKLASKPVKWVMQFLGKGSTEKPLTEKITELTKAVWDFGDYIEKASPTYTIDATPAIEALDDVKQTAEDYAEYEKGLWQEGTDAYNYEMEERTNLTEISAADRLHAYESMYSDLRGYENDYYAVQELLIEEQRQKYIELTGDMVAADAWAAQEHERLAREKTLASDSFFAGMKVGWQDMVDEQTTWAEHGKLLFDDVRSAWGTAVDDMVDAFVAGEDAKIDIAEITGDMLTDVTSSFAKRMFNAAIESIVGTIGALIGMGAGGSGGWGSVKGGAVGAATEVGIYLAAAAVAMGTAKTTANAFKAEGGWIGTHPQGGMIREGSGVADDVLLGYTPGVRHLGMGGEYVINREATARHRDLLELINQDRGMMTGGYLARTYDEGGPIIPWETTADMLFMGTAASFFHGWYKGAGPISGLVEAGVFLGSVIPSMFLGKYVANQVMSGGGMIDAGHGLGDFLSAPLSPITEGLDFIGDTLPGPLGDIVEAMGDTAVGKLQAISNYLDYRTGMMLDPDKMWEMIKDLIRTPLEAVAKDLVTPNMYYSDPLDTISNIVDYIKGEAFQAEQDLIGELMSFDKGGTIPRDGLFYGHEGERVLNKEETRAYKRGSERPIHVHNHIMLQVEGQIDGENFATWLWDSSKMGEIQIHEKAVIER